jgi:hypothetical protein
LNGYEIEYAQKNRQKQNNGKNHSKNVWKVKFSDKETYHRPQHYCKKQRQQYWGNYFVSKI